METIAWIGLAQSLFGAILVGTKHSASAPEKILAVWLCLLSVVFLSFGIDLKVYSAPLLTSSFLLFNPAIYLYVISLTTQGFSIKPIHLLHLIPFLFFEVFSHISATGFNPHLFLEADSDLPFRLLFAAANLASWAIYSPLTLSRVHKHRMELKNRLSTIESAEKLSWILFISVFYTVYWIILLFLSLSVVLAKANNPLPHYFNYSVMLALAFIITYYGVRQSEIRKFFSPGRYISADKKEDTVKEQKLSPEQEQKIREAVENYLGVRKGYKNPQLSMEMLSRETGFPRYQLTEVINKSMGSNFFQLVNRYRNEAAKEMLANKYSKYSIEAMGAECGFGSRSSFYSFFKKSEGVTPLEYRTKVLSQKDV